MTAPIQGTSSEFVELDELLAEDPDSPEFEALVERARVEREEWRREHHATLAQLRRALGSTQVQVAERTGSRQSDISALERRNDILVSTARAFVNALGADLELIARLPDGRAIHIDIGQIADQTP